MNHILPIGVDIQCNSISALQLTQQHKGFGVKASARRTLEDRLTGATEDIETLEAVIRSLVGKRRFKGRQVVVSLPQEYLFVFPVTIETTGQSTFEPALAQACARHLSFPLEQAVIDYFCVENIAVEAGRKLRVTVVAAHRESVVKVIRIFKRHKLSIGIIDYGLCGLIRLHNRIHSLSEAPSVLVHMDLESTLLAVATKSTIVAHRQLDWGMGRLEQRVAQMLQLDGPGEQSRAMLVNYGVDYDALREHNLLYQQDAKKPCGDDITALRAVSQILAPSMEELVRELFQIIGYARSVSPQIQFQELWLYGMATAIKNLGPFLERRLGFPAHPMKPFQKLGLAPVDDKTDNWNTYVYALGLALRGVA